MLGFLGKFKDTFCEVQNGPARCRKSLLSSRSYCEERPGSEVGKGAALLHCVPSASVVSSAFQVIFTRRVFFRKDIAKLDIELVGGK